MTNMEILRNKLELSVNDITDALKHYYEFFKSANTYRAERFRETLKSWLIYSMKIEYLKEYERSEVDWDKMEEDEVHLKFLRETAYVVTARILFTRLVEDKAPEVLGGRTIISGEGIANWLEIRGYSFPYPFIKNYEDMLDAMKSIYGKLFEKNVFFDWWLNGRDVPNICKESMNEALCKTFLRLNEVRFKSLERDILKDIYQRLFPPDERKELGEFYTPEPIVNYILDSVGWREDADIRGKKLLDPACGSGTFLVEATRRLIRSYEHAGILDESPEEVKQVIEAIINSIYGIDINPFAVFLSTINMVFQLLDLYLKVKKVDKSYTLPRIRIYCSDALLDEPPQTKLEQYTHNNSVSLAIEELKEAKKLKEVLGREGIDFIVGNPPYIRIDNVEHSLREAYKKKYVEEEKAAKGKWDVSIFFLWRGLKWLKENGYLGLIISNKFNILDMAAPFREKLIKFLCEKKYDIEKFIDLSGVEVFDQSLPSPCIIIIRRLKGEGAHDEN